MLDLDPAILAAVIASPDDDLPRLIAADWWEEHGQSDRAEFVRIQLELAPEKNRTFRRGPSDNARFNHYCHLRRRERELLGAMEQEPGGFSATSKVRWSRRIRETGEGILVDHSDFCRGFVEDVLMPWNYEHVAALRVVTPLRRARLATWPGEHTGWLETLAWLATEFPGIEFVLPGIGPVLEAV